MKINGTIITLAAIVMMLLGVYFGGVGIYETVKPYATVDNMIVLIGFMALIEALEWLAAAITKGKGGNPGGPSSAL